MRKQQTLLHSAVLLQLDPISSSLLYLLNADFGFDISSPFSIAFAESEGGGERSLTKLPIFCRPPLRSARYQLLTTHPKRKGGENGFFFSLSCETIWRLFCFPPFSLRRGKRMASCISHSKLNSSEDDLSKCGNNIDVADKNHSCCYWLSVSHLQTFFDRAIYGGPVFWRAILNSPFWAIFFPNNPHVKPFPPPDTFLFNPSLGRIDWTGKRKRKGELFWLLPSSSDSPLSIFSCGVIDNPDNEERKQVSARSTCEPPRKEDQDRMRQKEEDVSSCLLPACTFCCNLLVFRGGTRLQRRIKKVLDKKKYRERKYCHSL